MVAIDVRSLLKRAKAEKANLQDHTVASKAAGLLAAETLRQHASKQLPLQLAQHTVISSNSTPLQVTV